MKALELWGGPECTVNRVGDDYRDQLSETGHLDRLGDLDLITTLGVTALRFPILWERFAADEGSLHWRWAGSRLEALRRSGIRPIAGLVHHGRL